MKFSYKWLKELSGTEKSPEELAELFLARSFEVEDVKKYEHGLGSVVVGEVLETMPHPDANRLKVARVFVGAEERTIVCGAPNVAAGQKVAVALPGATLSARNASRSDAGGPNGSTIEETEIRGVKSSGMICAEDELGVGADHEGIWVLPESTAVGTPLADVMGLDDFVLDVKILPNRGTDALSHYGLAREIAALEERVFPSAGSFVKDVPERAEDGVFSVSIETAGLCPVYAGLSFRLSGRRRELPLLTRGRMMMLGIRSIHPAADIANLLSLLYGQPMHAFDAAKLSGKKIFVRFAKAGESLLLLDDRTIALSEEDLVIADEVGPIALAGIMGGKESAVSPATEEVFFEIAKFDPKTVRRSRVRHGLSTDAAYLFEHATDPSWPDRLRGEVIDSFSEEVGAEYLGGVSVSSLALPEDRILTFPFARVEALLGIAVPEDRVVTILRALSIGVEIQDGSLKLTIPSFRPDLEKEADIIEEVGRVFGYEHIEPLAPSIPIGSSEKNAESGLERSIKEHLACSGFDEIMTYSFYGENLLRQSGVPVDAHLALENPMNADQTYLRAKLLPTVLEKALENMPRTEQLRMFEFGRVHFRENGIVREEKRIALALSMKEAAPGEAFFAQKGMLERLFDVLRIQDVASFVPAEEVSPLFHPGRTARIMVGDDVVGVIGEAHPSFVRKFGLRRVAIAELSFPELLRLSGAPISMKPIPKFPSVSRDISLVVPRDVLYSELEQSILSSGGELLRGCDFFDLYEKGKEKNVAFHLIFGANDRTITGDEAEDAFQRIVSVAEESFGARLAL